MSLQTPVLNKGDQVLNLGDQGDKAFVARVADPVLTPQPYAQPADFAAQYPLLLDPTETIAMCDELTLYQILPEQTTALNGVLWRELNSLASTNS